MAHRTHAQVSWSWSFSHVHAAELLGRGRVAASAKLGESRISSDAQQQDMTSKEIRTHSDMIESEKEHLIKSKESARGCICPV